MLTLPEAEALCSSDSSNPTSLTSTLLWHSESAQRVHIASDTDFTALTPSLKNYPDSIGITYYLIARLSQYPESDVEFYWPQLWRVILDDSQSNANAADTPYSDPVATS